MGHPFRDRWSGCEREQLYNQHRVVYCAVDFQECWVASRISVTCTILQTTPEIEAHL